MPVDALLLDDFALCYLCHRVVVDWRLAHRFEEAWFVRKFGWSYSTLVAKSWVCIAPWLPGTATVF